jgi:uncharacterized protein (TIGR01777 family)
LTPFEALSLRPQERSHRNRERRATSRRKLSAVSRIIIAGGTGFLGRALHTHLVSAGHSVSVLTRRATGTPSAIEWQPDGFAGAWARSLDGVDAVVNLSGAGIADARWTASRKALLRESRVLSTRSLVSAIKQIARPPALINASGVGYYGDRGNELVTEATPPGRDFLAELCVAWEGEALEASHTTRVAILRNGLVMDPAGGALGKMLLPFRLGLGGRIGAGAQYLPWIHLADWLALVTHLIVKTDAHGPFNVTAPHPATNAEFTRALGKALSRPAVLPVPAFALRLALGELAETLLAGQRAIPQRAAQAGFTFQFADIGPALQDLIRSPARLP